MENPMGEVEFEAWLKKPGNYLQIEKLASSFKRKMALKGISIPGIDLRLTENQTEDICQELFAYLLTAPEIQRDLVQGAPHVFTRISRYFFNHVIDLNRGRENNQDIYKNTWRLFYRHVRSLVETSDQFIKFKSPTGEDCFGMSAMDPRTLVLPEDLPPIEFPADAPAEFEALNKKKPILKLAVYYWKKCAVLTGEAHIRLSVREFVSWVNQYVPLQSRVDAEWQSLSRESSGKAPLEQFSDECPTLDTVKATYLTTWAGNFFQTLPEKEKALFYYFECQGLKGAEISHLMGKKANLTYQRDRIRDKLKDFIRPLEWISPESGRADYTPDLEAFVFFRDELCRQLGLAVP